MALVLTAPPNGGIFEKSIAVCMERVMENYSDEESLVKTQFENFVNKIRLSKDCRSADWLETILSQLEQADQDLDKHSSIFRKITGSMTFGIRRIQNGIVQLLWTAYSPEKQFVLKDFLLSKVIDEKDIPDGLSEGSTSSLELLILFNNVALRSLEEVEKNKKQVPDPVIAPKEDASVTLLKAELARKQEEVDKMKKDFQELKDMMKNLTATPKKGKNKSSYSSDSNIDDSDESGDSDGSYKLTSYSVLNRPTLWDQECDNGSGVNMMQMDEYMERKKAQKRIYSKNSKTLTMEQMIRLICEGKGLLLYDVLGCEQWLTLRKSSSTRVLAMRVKRGVGPDGLSKASLSILNEAPRIFPQSCRHFEGFIREQITLASNARRLAVDRDAVKSIDDKVDVLNTFRDKMIRRIQLVMGEQAMYTTETEHHVTLWSVLLHFLIVIWNYAITADKFQYLVSSEVDTRWEREFAYKCRVTNNKTVQEVEESMKFLLYSCQNPKCGAFGMSANYCCFCTPMVQSASVGGSQRGFTRKQRDTAFKAWQATVPNGQPKSITEFLATHPQYQKTAPSGNTIGSLSAEAAWEMLACNQKLIKAPRVTGM